jgi:peptidyl-tRNA hydrolase, PTH1 family
MKLIVGLGNPGNKYERTRHNVGFVVLDTLRDKMQIDCGANDWELSKKFNAQICGCTLRGSEKILLAKPMTFMNGSGVATQLIMNYYKISAHDLIVVHDDKDIILGNIKVQIDRGPAGHNGVRSIIEHIGSQDFHRVRVGIASENENKMKDISKFVLNRFGFMERRKTEEVIQRAITEILKIIKNT